MKENILNQLSSNKNIIKKKLFILCYLLYKKKYFPISFLGKLVINNSFNVLY